MSDVTAKLANEANDKTMEIERLNAENAKLREELADAPKCETCEAMLDCDECLRADGSHKERRRLSAENAKLRDELDAAKHDLSLFSERIVELGAENAKLREQIHWLKKGDILHVLTDQEYIDQCERERLMQVSIDALDKDNAKLRELAAGIGHLLFTLDVDYCAICPRDDINHPCPVHTVEGGDCLYETDLRDLGVEVDA